MFDRLAVVRGDLLERCFGSAAVLGAKPLARARQLLRLTALTHDVGHCTFSHAAEKVLYGGDGHEWV
jgi:HD superfamily phosphohydrolase